VQLIVNDGSTHSAPDTVTISTENSAPVADAGADQSVRVNDIVQLDGSSSSDVDGDPLTFAWSFVSVPHGSSAVLSSTTAVNPTFGADVAGSYFVQLTVTDNGGLQDADNCTIIVTEDQVADSDGDGVPDDQDAFPNDPNEWEDTDGDGIGNTADADDDNDGMPDNWEIQYGFDPLVHDANEDPDGDGVNNLDEYQAGTDPTVDDYNAAPETPIILAPANNDLVSLTAVLQTDDFYDPDNGDFHLKTQWQIFDQQTDVCVFDVETATSLTTLSVPKLILDENTTYYWNVRFFDNHGAPSEWSEPAVFQTDINDEDADGNGIPDHQELQGFTDIDGDATADAQQNDIKCFNTEDGANFVGISIKDSPTVIAVDAVISEDPSSLLSNSASIYKPEYMPFGLINFKLLLTEPGVEAVVTVYVSEPAPDSSNWYKYDPVEETWQDYSAHAQISQDGTSIVLTLQDGGFGDADGTANGIIVDPSGIGTAAFSADENDSDNNNGLMGLADGLSASCFISAAAYDFSRMPFINTVLMCFLLGVLIVAAILKFKKSEQQK
jgi:hypothetical protein